MSMVSTVTDLVREDRDYDNWMDTLTEASTRLDVLQTAVIAQHTWCARDLEALRAEW
ncbi:MAG: hypothetical protein QOC62_5755 [Mycobacterium sp.]|jgi:hypothetical protein|nr:hypothetical protein [Mycobacterium sp.]